MFTIIQYVTPPLTHVEIPRSRDATELNNDGMIKFVDVLLQTEPNLSIFPKEILSTMTPVSVRLFFQQLTCSIMFFLLKSFSKMSIHRYRCIMGCLCVHLCL